jgi:hypothetical protein
MLKHHDYIIGSMIAIEERVTRKGSPRGWQTFREHHVL